MFNLYTLKNGLRVVTEKIEHGNSISIGIMIQNGSRNESQELNGISHFIEHMFFKGTDKRNFKEIVTEVENVGGQINAFTSKEATCYYIKALHTHLDLAVDILSDMILNSKFDPEDIKREQSVVVEEINMGEDNPEDVLDDLHSRVTYGDGPLSMPILGTADKVKSFTKEKIKKFIQEKYTPYNAVISICGKFDDKELLKMLEEGFGEWKSDIEYTPSYGDTIIHSGTGYINKDLEQLHMNLTLPGLPHGDSRGYSLVLLNNIFGGGASSILFQKVREELGLCYTVYSYPQVYQGIGTLDIYTGLSKSYGEKAISVINRELEEFTKFEISDEMILINKEKIKGSYILGLESTSSKMFANARSIIFKNKITTESDVIERIDKINKEDIKYVLENCFGKGIINTAFVGPNIDVDKLNSLALKSEEAYNNKNQGKIEV